MACAAVLQYGGSWPGRFESWFALMREQLIKFSRDIDRHADSALASSFVSFCDQHAGIGDGVVKLCKRC